MASSSVFHPASHGAVGEHEKVHTVPSRDQHQPSEPRLRVVYVTALRQSPWMYYVVISLGVVGGEASLARAQLGCWEEGSPSQMNGRSFSQPTEWSLGL